MQPQKTHPPTSTTPIKKAPNEEPFLLRCGRLPGWAVQELQAHYRKNGIEASDEQAYEDLAKLVDLFKLVLRHTPDAPDAPKTTYYSEEQP